MKLKDKTAIISGGSRGIGGACVELFAQEGANVVIGDVLEADGQALALARRCRRLPQCRRRWWQSCFFASCLYRSTPWQGARSAAGRALCGHHIG